MRIQRPGLAGHPCPGDYAAAVRFSGETLGLEVAFDEGTVEPAAGNGNKIQRLGPGHPYFDFCRGQGAGTVQPLEVALDQAGAELARG
jgi:hypothetical protein